MTITSRSTASLVVILFTVFAFIPTAYSQYAEATVRQIQEVPLDSLRQLDSCTTGHCSWTYQASRFMGDTVTVTGLCIVPPRILTYTLSGFTLVLYDTSDIAGWRGILVRCSLDTNQHIVDGFLNIQRGQVLRMTGVVSEFPVQDVLSITEFQPIPGIPIQILGSRNVPFPTRICADELSRGVGPLGRPHFATGEQYEGMIVEMTCLEVSSWANPSSGTFRFVDSTGLELTEFDASRFFTLRSHGGLPDSVWQSIFPLPGTQIDTLRGLVMSVGTTAVSFGYRIAPIMRGDVVFRFPAFVPENLSAPEKLVLHLNYPNPFNPSTTISFSLPQTENITLKVYDMLGREVATLVDGRREAGEHSVKWNAESFASGVYFYQLRAGGFVETRKLALAR